MTTEEKKEIVKIFDSLVEEKVLPRFDEQDRKMEALFLQAEKNTDKKIDALAIMLNGQFQKIDERFDRLEERMDRLEKRVSALEETVGSLKYEIARLNERISKLEDRMESLERKVDEIKKMSIDDVIALGEDIDKERKRIDRLENLYKRLAGAKSL